LYIWCLIAGQQRVFIDKNRVAMDQDMMNMFTIAAGTFAILSSSWPLLCCGLHHSSKYITGKYMHITLE
ncbi:hypothetical protein cypCar_00000497, partial [Cyprinus carpio]